VQPPAHISVLTPPALAVGTHVLSSALEKGPDDPGTLHLATMSIGPSLLLVHERPNGDITLALSQGGDLYRLETTETTSAPTLAKRQRTQNVVRCSDGAVLASVSWVDHTRDLVRIGQGDSWVRLDEAWKAAVPAQGDWYAFSLIYL
jgi:hypothetical protein